MKANDKLPIHPLIAILFLGFSILCQPSSGYTEPAEFVVFFSGNIFGELEACGG